MKFAMDLIFGASFSLFPIHAGVLETLLLYITESVLVTLSRI